MPVIFGDKHCEGISLGNLGSVYNSLGDYQKAIAFYEQSLNIARKIGDKKHEEIRLKNLGDVYNYLGKYQNSIAFYEQALIIAQKIGDKEHEGICFGNLGLPMVNLATIRK